ncbi:structural protein [Pantoea phage vB_PagM_AAM37]|uniref:Structural protein n=1 Tax=Pantoea phage vB_PagM_AAM37 TaxID=2588093 RepID=A0A513ZY90_9CAUD|nr:structural protein [Pantoea phage vB_PagM_AAM37]QDH45679.1 structural protein [Pantoea phage vB_PagM_AAM37]
MAVQTNTPMRMLVAHRGMIADTALRQVDGTTAANDRIEIGRPVIVVRGDNNTKLTRHMVAGDLTALSGKLIGVTMHSHWANVTGFYEKGDAVNVMRVGRVWAVTPLTAAPTAGQVVNIVVSGDPALPAVSNTGGTAIPGWQFSGAFETEADGTHIAEIELTIPQIMPAAGAGA